jgi:glutamate racemase
VFDSGIGGLSVLRHIHRLLPQHPLLYVADSGFAPYGEKPESVIVARALAIADFLLQRGAKALVVACNTATVAAIKTLRERHPNLPLVGVEPGLKPAAALSANKIVGVLATDRTLAGDKFIQLHRQISAASGVRFLLQACTGLAAQIESGQLDCPATDALLQAYIAPLIAQGADTLVLGCTHYPFVLPQIEKIIRASTAHKINIVDTGEAVARQLVRLLAEHPLGAAAMPADQGGLHLSCFTSGSKAALENAFASLLGWHPASAELPIF